MKKIEVLVRFLDRNDKVTIHRPSEKFEVDEERAEDLIARGLARLDENEATEAAAEDGLAKEASEKEAAEATEKERPDEAAAEEKEAAKPRAKTPKK